ncbi:Gfo/Idh/MocA family protein [Geobacter sp.]|uniref:Gfo/Idh/MocA family protein n=1 Tax=Geobacter sp. TaxID=46610 RepID=UPI0027B9A19C|nr:Gfo/Idh/MocA family oxidoreductase [Geobacter sp.]
MSVKFAIIGCGAIGSRHAAVIDAEARGSITSLCDCNVMKAEQLDEKYSLGVKCFADYDALLASTNANVINICTPHGLHAEMAIKAAKAGKHILVEKPMALTVADAEAMMTAASDNGVYLMVVKQNRFNVPIALTKKAIDSGKLGRVFMVQCHVLWNRHDGYYADSNWRGSKELEGGALYTQASHFIDLLNWWFGDVVDVKAEIATKNHAIDIEDCGNALLTFDSGVMGALTWTTCVYNKNYEGSITIIAENGTIKIGGPYLNKIEYWDVKAMPLQDDICFVDKPNAYGKYQGTSSNHDKVVTNVVAKLLNERHHVVEGDEGIMSIKAIEMIYNNARVI